MHTHWLIYTCSLPHLTFSELVLGCPGDHVKMPASQSTDAALQMLNDQFPFGVVCEIVVPEDGTVVELGQAVNADLMCLHDKQFVSSQTSAILV